MRVKDIKYRQNWVIYVLACLCVVISVASSGLHSQPPQRLKAVKISKKVTHRVYKQNFTKKYIQPYALPSGITTIDHFSDETVAHLFEPDGHSPCFPWRLPLPHALPHGLPLPHGEEEALWDTQSITNVWKYILLCVECVVDCYAAIPYISQIAYFSRRRRWTLAVSRLTTSFLTRREFPVSCTSEPFELLNLDSEQLNMVKTVLSNGEERRRSRGSPRWRGRRLLCTGLQYSVPGGGGGGWLGQFVTHLSCVKNILSAKL